MKRFILLFIAISMLVLNCSDCEYQHRYAVLISTNNVTVDDSPYHSVWWYDTFLMYKMLREQGYNDSRIFVLYGNGADFNTTHACYNATTQYNQVITDFACTKANIQAVFNGLAVGDTALKIPQLTGKDKLYIWWMGHGGGAGPGSCNLTMEISHMGEQVTDVEFTNYINAITYMYRVVQVMTCHSGGMVDNLNVAGTNTIVHTSSDCPHSSFEAGAPVDVNHAEFTLLAADAFRRLEPNAAAPCDGAGVASDSDGNSRIQVQECFDYVLANMTTSTPQQGDPDGLAATTYIR